ncbi:MAG: hypothetical protein HIU82_15755 [Proteobacteria bacterium]|jgi:hypothetical protein|nr:hypothetical protein [Pseudomonadota bacterium]
MSKISSNVRAAAARMKKIRSEQIPPNVGLDRTGDFRDMLDLLAAAR